LGEIKKAYRAAAKRSHPDVSHENEEKFKEIQQAYETLSDPAKRKDYNQQLSRQGSSPVGHWHDVPFAGWAPSIFDYVEHLFSGLNPLLGRWWADSGPKEREGPTLEIVLTPEEARRGGEMGLDIPWQGPCVRCHGSGRVGRLICGRCRGRGIEESIRKTRLRIPPRVRDRSRAKVRIDFPEGGGIELAVLIRVGGRQEDVNSRQGPAG